MGPTHISRQGSGSSSLGWKLDGNTEGSLKYFGTNDNFDIPIYTNGVQIGVFSATGNLGIGQPTPLTKIDVAGGSIRSVGASGASGGDGVELYVGGLKSYDYSGGTYSNNIDFDAVSHSFSLQGVNFVNIAPNGTNGVGIGAGVQVNTKLFVKTTNNTSGHYGLDVSSLGFSQILTAQNNGRVGVNTVNSSALSVQSKIGDFQIISYSNAFNVSLLITDNDGAALGDGTVLINGSLRVDRVTGNVAIGSSVMAGNRLYVKAPTATENTLYLDSLTTNGNVILGFHSEDGFLFMASKTLASNTVFIKSSGASYLNGGQLSMGTTTPDASALFQMDSTTQGFRVPRMTGSEKAAIVAVDGLIVFDTSLAAFTGFNGGVWTVF